MSTITPLRRVEEVPITSGERLAAAILVPCMACVSIAGVWQIGKWLVQAMLLLKHVKIVVAP